MFGGFVFRLAVWLWWKGRRTLRCFEVLKAFFGNGKYVVVEVRNDFRLNKHVVTFHWKTGYIFKARAVGWRESDVTAMADRDVESRRHGEIGEFVGKVGVASRR